MGWLDENQRSLCSSGCGRFFGAMGYQMCHPLRNLGVSDCLGWCLLRGQKDLGWGLCSSSTLVLFVQDLHGWSIPLVPRWGFRSPLSSEK